VVANAPITVPVTALAAQVYSPPVVGKPHVFIYNTGPGTVYVGGPGVTVNQGLPLPAKQQIDYGYAPNPLYAVVGGLTLSGTITTTTTAAITHGASTKVTVTAITNFAAGQTVQVGAGTAAETLAVASTSTAPSITFTTQPQLDHVSGAAVTVVTNATTGTLRVVPGTS
jgi:hypothetical protein